MPRTGHRKIQNGEKNGMRKFKLKDQVAKRLKKLENDGHTMPSYAELKELQIHIDKIKKSRATSELGVTRGKNKDKNQR